MIKLNDERKMAVEGTLAIYKKDRLGRKTLIEPVENVILIQSANIIRDLMFSSNDARITHMGFGDLNLTEQDDLVNVDAANPEDTGLVNEVGRVATTSVTTEVGGAPAIIYTAQIDYNMMNGSGRQIITEYCLITGDNRAFNKKNRSALIKDSEFAYEFRWTLRFV